jgi:uncharacterized protein (DUF697 family)/uncharacterized tellurite resistance protein B-like protein
MENAEILASIRLLVAVAKADGTLHPDERASLSTALEEVEIEDAPELQALLGEDVDVDAQIALLKTQEARTEAYRSAYSMAFADGQCSEEERALLETLRTRLVVPEKDASATERMFAEAKDMVLPSNINPIADPEARAREIREDILRYSALSAALGAFPVPGLAIATDLAVVALQVKLIRDIGQYHGHTVDGPAARSMLYGIGFGTGARVAISNLVKFVPGYGSVFGATTAFATTFALGKTFDKFFQSHRDFDASKFDPKAVKSELKEARAEGKSAFKEHKEEVDTRAAAAKSDLDKLNAELAAGTITQAQYEKKVAELA